MFAPAPALATFRLRFLRMPQPTFPAVDIVNATCGLVFLERISEPQMHHIRQIIRLYTAPKKEFHGCLKRNPSFSYKPPLSCHCSFGLIFLVFFFSFMFVVIVNLAPDGAVYKPLESSLFPHSLHDVSPPHLLSPSPPSNAPHFFSLGFFSILLDHAPFIIAAVLL